MQSKYHEHSNNKVTITKTTQPRRSITLYDELNREVEVIVIDALVER